MKSSLTLAGAAFSAALAMSGAAGAVTLTFDSDTPFTVPTDGGLTYNNLEVINRDCCGASGYYNGNVSPNNDLFDPFGSPGSLTSATPFTLNSFYLAAAWNDGLNVLVQGKNGATVVDSIVLTVSTAGPTLETLNWANLTEVDFTPSGGVNHGYNGAGTHFVIDNLTINGVPEPASWGLMLLGFAAVGGAVRSRRVLAA